MEATVAKAPEHAAQGGDVHLAAENVDNAAQKGGRKRSRDNPRGSGLANPKAVVGGDVSRRKNAKSINGGSALSLARAPRRTHLSANIKDWKGKWRREQLTDGERYWITRMRLGEDQHAAARRLKTTRWAYQGMEQSKDNEQSMKITDFEWCRIMRRRVGKSQSQVAIEMNISRIAVHEMEIGEQKCDNLLWYWEH